MGRHVARGCLIAIASGLDSQHVCEILLRSVLVLLKFLLEKSQ